MKKRFRVVAGFAAALLAGAVAQSTAPPARAADDKSFNDCLARLNHDGAEITKDCFGVLIGTPFKPKANDADALAASPARTAPSATYILNSVGSDLRDGEPTFGGRMKNSIWGYIAPAKPSRLVLHTFGSDIDTVLAAYRVKVAKTGAPKYGLLEGNDYRPVPGVGRGWSLVTVDLKKGDYAEVQIGGQGGATSNRVALTATAFGTNGGISAFLFSTTAGATMQGRDYVCEQRPCPSASFVLHNSTKASARVSPSTTLPRFFSDPQPVTLPADGLAVVTFVGRDVSSEGGVAESGAFAFDAAAGGKTLESVEKTATVFLADPAGSPIGLAMSAEDRLEVGELNEKLNFKVSLRNTGRDAARGCGFRSLQSNFRNVLTRFRPLGPTGAWGEAADIAAGGSRSFEVEVASMAPRQGDPQFGLADEVQGACVNRQPPEVDLLNTLEVNADGSGNYTVIDAKVAGGASLAVPAGGEASFDVTATNGRRAAGVVARPTYAYPFDAYDPDQQYALSVCRLDKKKRCEGAKGFSAFWAARKKGAKASFRVFVKAPREKPPSDPGRFRIYLRFEGENASWPNLFGAASVPVSVK